jgi:outer membrane protein OmpA-like peptidoglycan-associated protein
MKNGILCGHSVFQNHKAIEQRHCSFLFSHCSFLISLFFFLFVSHLSAQVSTAEKIETILNTGAITYGQAAAFTLEAANLIAANNNEEALNYAIQRNWLPANVGSGAPARLDRLSLLLMRSFDMKGGIMFSIFKNPHYAYRELKHQKIIQSRSSPGQSISGEQLLSYISKLLVLYDLQSVPETIIPETNETSETSVEARRETLAAEIAVIIEEQKIADTTVEATDEGVMITLSNIVFEADSAVLPNTEGVKIFEIARVLYSIAGVKLHIAGHTALAGSEETRDSLSRQRAQSVADYLVFLGAVKAADVSISGYGSNRPIADNSTPQGMAANRRVEIIILEN